MKSISATLIPREDKKRDGAWNYDRAIDLEILTSTSGARTWRLVSDSSDGRYRFNRSQGVWNTWKTPSGQSQFFLIDEGRLIILSTLYAVGSDVYDRVTCGNSLEGDADGITADLLLYYRLAFLCV